MKNIIVMTFCFVFCLATSALSQEKVKVGISTALSGNGASLGEDIKNAAIFANRTFADNRYDLVFEDDKCNGKDAVTIAQKLINIDQIKYVFGFACSGALLASAPIYQRADVLMFSSASSAPQISELGDFVFRTWPSDVHAAQVLYDYISNNHKMVGVITEETEYAKQLAQAFIGQNNDRKLTIIEETFLTDESDFKPLVFKFKNRKVEAVFINSQTEVNFVQVLRQLRDLKYNGKVYGAFYPESSTFQKLAGEIGEGVIYVDIPSAQDATGERGKEVLDRFRKEMGEPQYSEILVLLTMDAFYAMSQADINSKAPKEYLHSNKFSGVTGEFQFDEHGDIKGIRPIMKVIKNGKGSKI